MNTIEKAAKVLCRVEGECHVPCETCDFQQDGEFEENDRHYANVRAILTHWAENPPVAMILSVMGTVGWKKHSTEWWKSYQRAEAILRAAFQAALDEQGGGG